MNSEKVKEIKELLLRKSKEYESQTLLDILTLINVLESENKILKKDYDDIIEDNKDLAEENERLYDAIQSVKECLTEWR